jgi:hypothetical protein
MFGSPKKPLDRRPYPQSTDSRPLGIGEQVGRFVYVVDLQDTIHVAPDAPHAHPRVLGLAQEALHAGEIAINQPGHVVEITNLSGTFQFSDRGSLCCVATHLRRIGFVVNEVVWYPPNGSTGPIRLQCP